MRRYHVTIRITDRNRTVTTFEPNLIVEAPSSHAVLSDQILLHRAFWDDAWWKVEIIVWSANEVELHRSTLHAS